MTNLKKKIVLLLAIVFALGLLAGCGGSSGGGDAASSAGGSSATAAETGGDDGGAAAATGEPIKLGLVTPATGPLSGFGEDGASPSDTWIEDQLIDYVNNTLGGIEIDGEMRPIELVVYDSQSDTTVATQMAEKLITDDKVDLMLVRHTPETVNPVSAVCERYEMPCVAMDAPVDAWLAEGPYEWVYHAHWNLDQMYQQYRALWEKAGFAVGSGAKIGLLFANDADGTAWRDTFATRIEEDGYTLVDPGQYPADTSDFSDIVNQFKSEGVQILCGTNTCPVFGTFWRQAKQLGFEPDMVTMGKAYLLRSDAEAIDGGTGIMDKLAGETWWAPTHPFKSSLTGLTPQELADNYLAETGREITQPMGLKYADMEVAIDALQRAGTLEKTALRDAIGATDLETMIGPVKYNEDHYSLTTLTGGQWVLDDTGTLQLKVVDNSLFPDIPTTGELQPLK
ncbi:MAG: ABC transporter substrate-binding protein [Clostridiales Family XIII bacterium]|jgi:branched-chain amino acid transport system substrate-binding protein|nr:ABC transporter substrate-binding protein [Clostridiales Family XIII bacterium]